MSQETPAAQKVDPNAAKLKELRTQYGRIAHLMVDKQPFAFRPPELEEYEEYQDMLVKGSRGAAFRQLAQVTLVLPADVEKLEAIFRKYPASPARIADAIADIAGADFEVTVKKE